MNILDEKFEPLNDFEMCFLNENYTQNFDEMPIEEAQKLLKLLLSVGDLKDSMEPKYHSFLLRRLHMIINWTEYPERLL